MTTTANANRDAFVKRVAFFESVVSAKLCGILTANDFYRKIAKNADETPNDELLVAISKWLKTSA